MFLEMGQRWDTNGTSEFVQYPHVLDLNEMETWMKWVFDGIWWYQILDLGTNMD